MIVNGKYHLTYCTNIHPGESWEATFENLRKHSLLVKKKIAANEKFGIGLRLSNEASLTLSEEHNLQQFREWLVQENLYVFTLNGFPYGNFHKSAVKDQVHTPDWITPERLNYTLRLFDILKQIIPNGMDGGISTSPLSYRHWFPSENALSGAKTTATRHLIEVIKHLSGIKETTGIHLHLDIEPEPDGIIETSEEFVDYFENHLLRQGKGQLAKVLGISAGKAEQLICDHLQVCFDVCHFSVGYEDPEMVLDLFEKHGIQTGKIQISAALSAVLNNSSEKNELIKQHLTIFDEPVYLHQAVIKKEDGTFLRYPDLKPALEELSVPGMEELRTHYHVPVFTDRYQLLKSTNADIIKLLERWKKSPFTNHLEVETYTWDVLPEALKTDIEDSIYRELKWVLHILAK